MEYHAHATWTAPLQLFSIHTLYASGSAALDPDGMPRHVRITVNAQRSSRL